MSKILLSALLLVLPVAGFAAPKGKSTVAPKAGDFIGNWQCRTQIGDEVQDDSTIQFKPNARYTSQATLTFRIVCARRKRLAPTRQQRQNQLSIQANRKRQMERARQHSHFP